MAKRTNLLLTVALAVVCLTALLFALALPTTTANAETVNITQYQKATTVTDGDYIIVATDPTSGNNYAWTLDKADSSSNSLKSVEIQGDTISSVNGKDVADLEAWQKWKVTVDGANIYLQSYSEYQYAKGKYYHNNYGYGMTSDSTAKALLLQAQAADGSFELAPYTNNNFCYINTKGSWSYSNSSSYKPAKITFYKATSVSIENAVTVSFVSGNDAATGTMSDKVVSSGATYTLPTCGFSLTNYVFNGWKINDAETPIAAGEIITVTADTTLTADWTYNVYDITYILESNNPESKTATKYVVKGNAYSIPNFESIFSASDLPAGKLFADKWVDAEGTEYTRGSSVTLTSNVTLYPVYADAFTITFDWNGGTAPSSTSSYACYINKNVLPDSNYTLYKYTSTTNYRPTKTDYILAGWENAETGEQYLADLTNTNDQTVSVTITKDTVFKAVWKFDGFTITFMVDNDVYATKTYAKSTSTSSQYFYFAAEGVEMPEAPDGKEFAKWTTTSKYNSNNSYTISGSAGASNYSGQYLVLPGESTTSYYKITNYDVVLNATFQNLPINVTFKFKNEDGTIYKTENKTISASSSSASVSLSNTYAGTVPEGYAVLNWTDEEENIYTSGTSVYIYRTDAVYEKTFTVHYAKAVKITFDGNGGTMSSSYSTPVSVAENSQYKLPTYSSAATLSGFTLCGFISSADNEFYALAAIYQLGNEDVTFTAQWKYDGYTLTFKVDGQEDVVKLVEQKYSGYNENTTYKIDVANPTMENAEFLGWALNGDTSKLFKNGDTITTAQLQALKNRSGELVAQFKVKEMVTISFHFGEKVKEIKVEKKETGTNYQTKHVSEYFPNWTDSGYNYFGGWATNPELTGTLVAVNSWRGSSEDTHYYAVVETTFKVTFVYGNQIANAERSGRTSSPAQVPYESTTTVEGQQVDIREGYTLLGWSTTEGGEIVYAAERNVTVDHECTLYAVWRYDYKKVVIEVVNDGNKTTIESEVFMRNKTQFTLDDVLKELTDEQKALFAASEHRTAKWINLADGREITSTEKVTYPTGDDDETGEAKFPTLRVTVTDKLYTITFTQSGDEAIAPIQVKFGADISGLKPADPVRAGYEFISWNLSGKVFEWTTMPGNDVSLTGIWKALPSTLKFDLNGGVTADGKDTMADITLDSATAFDKPVNPTKEGYDFVYWTLNGTEYRWTKHDTTDTYYGTMPGGTNTLVAVWELNSANRRALKDELTAQMTAYAREKGVEVPANEMENVNTDTEAKIRKVYADVIEIIDYKAAALEELTAYAERFNVALSATDTLSLRDAKDKATTDTELALGKAAIDIKALANAKAAAKTAITAAATEGGVTEPERIAEDIDQATTLEQVEQLKTTALEQIAEAVAEKQAAEAAAALAAAKTAAKQAVADAAAEGGVTAPDTTAIDEAATIEAVNTAKTAALAKVAEAIAQKQAAAELAKAKTDAKAALAAYAAQKEVTTPASLAEAIDKAATTEAVAAALAAGKAEIDRLATPEKPDEPTEDANVTAAKTAITAAVNANGVKDALAKIATANEAIAKLTAEQKAKLDLTAFNAKVAEINAKVNGAKADLEGARKVADGLVLSAAMTVALITVAAWIAKRRTF